MKQFERIFSVGFENSIVLMEQISHMLSTTDEKPPTYNNHLKLSNVSRLVSYECVKGTDAPEPIPEKRISFSIDYILGIDDEKKDSHVDLVTNVQYDWLNYTRYRPPKLQRIRKKECVQRRRLGRNPRIPFSSEQVAILEEKFLTSPYLSNTDVLDLSKSLQLSESRIKIWFQNRRARERRDLHDTSKKGLNLIKSFLIKTRPNDVVPEEVQDLSMSAFKPCQTYPKCV